MLCSVDGVLYPCQRTGRGALFEIGDADRGIDVERAVRLVEASRLLGDCGNCPAKRLCTMCTSFVSEDEGSGTLDGSPFRDECVRMIDGLVSFFKEYTILNETNPGIVKNADDGSRDEGWVYNTRLLPSGMDSDEMKVGVEELQGYS